MADSMNPCKMLWGRPLLPWQRNLAWGGGDLVAYRIVFFFLLLLFTVCSIYVSSVVVTVLLIGRRDVVSGTQQYGYTGRRDVEVWTRHRRSSRQLCHTQLDDVIACDVIESCSQPASADARRRRRQHVTSLVHGAESQRRLGCCLASFACIMSADTSSSCWFEYIWVACGSNLHRLCLKCN